MRCVSGAPQAHSNNIPAQRAHGRIRRNDRYDTKLTIVAIYKYWWGSDSCSLSAAVPVANSCKPSTLSHPLVLPFTCSGFWYVGRVGGKTHSTSHMSCCQRLYE